MTHEKLVQEHKSNLTQNQALQILFDLKFIMSILMGRAEHESSGFPDRLDLVADTLESCVDPFDLDVFSPHISTNLNRQLQRCGVCVILIPNRTFLVGFGGISGEFGRAKLRMARPNEADMPPKRTKKVRLGIYRTQIQPKI